MRTSTLLLTAALSAAGVAAFAGPAEACACRVRHHAVYRHAVHVRHHYRPYTYSYRTPVYYGYDYGYDPYVYDSYYDWSYVPAPRTWVTYEGPYGWYGGDWRWRRHHHWRGDWGWEGRGRWHGGGHGHWDHGRHGH